ncbi:hypothetical protein RAC69_04825 [Microbacterium sp. LS_15]|uniref:hypothetical protein n=1 Tax=Microbacterium sp. LS_15 TaxID=3055790 RepID=UPI0035BF9446
MREIGRVCGGERLDDDGFRATQDCARGRDDRDALIVGHSGERVVAERAIQVGDDLIEELAGAGCHTPIQPVASDIRTR